MIYSKQIATESQSKIFFQKCLCFNTLEGFKVFGVCATPQFSATRKPQQVEKQYWCQTIQKTLFPIWLQYIY